MKKNETNTEPLQLMEGKKKKIAPAGYPLYAASEDIFVKYKEEKDLNPEDPSRSKEANEPDKESKDVDHEFRNDVTGGDLDITGPESASADDIAGREDEENNLYSLGGDDHNDLDETN
jgi:hypothetical protein